MPVLTDGNRKEPPVSENDSRPKPFDFSVRVTLAPKIVPWCSSRTVPLNAAAPEGACAASGHRPTRVARDKIPVENVSCFILSPPHPIIVRDVVSAVLLSR